MHFRTATRSPHVINSTAIDNLVVQTVHQWTVTHRAVNESNTTIHHHRAAIASRRSLEITILGNSVRCEEPIAAEPSEIDQMEVVEEESCLDKNRLVVWLPDGTHVEIAGLPEAETAICISRENTSSREFEIACFPV